MNALLNIIISIKSVLESLLEEDFNKHGVFPTYAGLLFFLAVMSSIIITIN